MRFPLASLANTGALSRKDEMKTVEECKEEVAKLLQTGLQAGLISQDEFDTALKLQSWEALQPIPDKAQGVDPADPAEDELKTARAEHLLHRSDFTNTELKMLRVLAPDEYRLLK